MSTLIGVKAQILTTEFDENVLKMRVKQLDEFISRFNYETDIEGNKIEKPDIDMRKKYILSLFNQDILKSDSVFKLAEQFIDYACNKDTAKYIKFSDNNWYAQAFCKVKYNNKEHDISIVLKPEKIKEFEYKWVICAVSSEFLKIKPEKINLGLMISPVDNELGFMSLPDISKQGHTNVLNYASKNYKVDELSVFFALIQSNRLKITAVNKIKYHFMQLNNWVFTVEHFNRKGDNAGWLISSIKNLNLLGSKEYSKQILNIN